MEKRFFIMMYSQSGETAFPMETGDDNDVAFFATEREAREAADNHFVASNFGYDIFEMGDGI